MLEWYSSVWLVLLVTLARSWQAMYSSLTQRELTREPYISEYLAMIVGRIMFVQSIS
jgi:hypothetical protein